MNEFYFNLPRVYIIAVQENDLFRISESVDTHIYNGVLSGWVIFEYCLVFVSSRFTLITYSVNLSLFKKLSFCIILSSTISVKIVFGGHVEWRINQLVLIYQQPRFFIII